MKERLRQQARAHRPDRDTTEVAENLLVRHPADPVVALAVGSATGGDRH